MRLPRCSSCRWFLGDKAGPSGECLLFPPETHVKRAKWQGGTLVEGKVAGVRRYTTEHRTCGQHSPKHVSLAVRISLRKVS